MVLDLSVICLRSICDGVESGRIGARHLAAYISPHYLGASAQTSATNLRQRLLDLALIRRSMDNPNCIAAFSSAEFMDGMTSLITTTNTRGPYYLAEFVEHLATTLGTTSRMNPEMTIGSRFRELRLWTNGNMLESIGNIISNCPNLRSLELMIVRSGMLDTSVQLFDTSSPSVRLLAQNPVVSNLEHLSIEYRSSIHCDTLDMNTLRLLILDHARFSNPLLDNIRFSNLRSIRVRGLRFHGDVWMRFLQSVRSTLVSLEVESVDLVGGNDQLIPFAMERLQRFRTNSHQWSIDILAQCDELAFLSANLHGWMGTAEARAMLQRLNVDWAMDITMTGQTNNLFVAYQSRFRMVDIFGDRITELTFYGDETENEQYVAALAHVFAACRHLTRFRFVCGPPSSPTLDLAPLFNDSNNLRTLRQIKLYGNINVGKLFETYLDLDTLNLSDNPAIRDEDLIGWMRRGGGRRLSCLELSGWPNLTYDAIVALLIASGSTLESFFYRGNADLVERLRGAAVAYCPFAITSLCPE